MLYFIGCAISAGLAAGIFAYAEEFYNYNDAKWQCVAVGSGTSLIIITIILFVYGILSAIH